MTHETPQPDADPSRSRRLWAAVALGLVVALAVALWAASGRHDKAAAPSQSFAPFADASAPPRLRASAPPLQAPRRRRQAPRPAPQAPHPAPRAPHPAPQASHPAPQAPSPDAGLDAAHAPQPQWADPTNQRVLGRRSWMATMSDAGRQAIDDEFDRPRPHPYPYDLKVRRNGIDVARGIVEDCFERLQKRQPDATGRIMVAFDLVATGQRGQFRKVSLPAVVKLHDPRFQDCITGGLANASFATGEQGVMHVEYPFFFDGADQARPFRPLVPRTSATSGP